MAIHRINPNVTVGDVKRSVLNAKENSPVHSLLYSWPTVEFLLNTIDELTEELSKLQNNSKERTLMETVSQAKEMMNQACGMPQRPVPPGAAMSPGQRQQYIVDTEKYIECRFDSLKNVMVKLAQDMSIYDTRTGPYIRMMVSDLENAKGACIGRYRYGNFRPEGAQISEATKKDIQAHKFSA